MLRRSLMRHIPFSISSKASSIASFINLHLRPSWHRSALHEQRRFPVHDCKCKWHIRKYRRFCLTSSFASLPPLFSHGFCDAIKSLASAFSASAFSACAFVFWFMRFAITSRRTIRPIIFYDICRLQWFKPFYPKASFFAPWLSELIWLYDLCILW